MAIMLPSEVSYLLNMLGYEWPEGNEDTIFSWGGRWMSYAGEVDGSAQLASSAHDFVVGANEGSAVKAFSAAFKDGEGIEKTAHDLGSAGNVIGGVLYEMGAVVIALKIVVVVQLVLLAIQIAEAVAAAAATFGASLAWIPVAKIIASKAIEFGINYAIGQLLG